MIVTYDIYKRRTSDGKRYELIQDYESLSITLNWKKRSKFSIDGKAVKKAPINIGEYIVVFRNSQFIFEGLVQEVEVECEDVVSETIEWTASGEDDGVIFDWRVILTDTDTSHSLSNLTFDNDAYDKAEGYAYDRMSHYIRNCYKDTFNARKISGLSADNQFPNHANDNTPSNKRGTVGPSAYRLKKLSDVLKEIGEEDNLFAKYTWNPISGAKNITIPVQRDKSGGDATQDIIVISPQYGNVASWSVDKTYPKYNAVWVCSGEYDVTEGNKTYSTRLWVYAEDTASINKYGRIEFVLTKSDIKVREDDASTPENEALTASEVINLLREEARKALQENAAKEKYTIKIAEIDELRFMDDYMVGDKVKAVIDWDETTQMPKVFYPTIETVSINYSNLEEKLTPTIGEMEEGIFSNVFEMIDGIDRRLKSEEDG